MSFCHSLRLMLTTRVECTATSFQESSWSLLEGRSMSKGGELRGPLSTGNSRGGVSLPHRHLVPVTTIAECTDLEESVRAEGPRSSFATEEVARSTLDNSLTAGVDGSFARVMTFDERLTLVQR